MNINYVSISKIFSILLFVIFLQSLFIMPSSAAQSDLNRNHVLQSKSQLEQPAAVDQNNNKPSHNLESNQSDWHNEETKILTNVIAAGIGSDHAIKYFESLFDTIKWIVGIFISLASIIGLILSIIGFKGYSSIQTAIKGLKDEKLRMQEDIEKQKTDLKSEINTSNSATKEAIQLEISKLKESAKTDINSTIDNFKKDYDEQIRQRFEAEIIQTIQLANCYSNIVQADAFQQLLVFLPNKEQKTPFESLSNTLLTKSITQLESIIADGNAFERAYLLLGNAQKRLGKYNEALIVLEKLLELPEANNRSSDRIYYNAACYAALCNNSDKALTNLRSAVSLNGSLRNIAKMEKDFISIRDDVRFIEITS
jgi:hypothetical protein